MAKVKSMHITHEGTMKMFFFDVYVSTKGQFSVRNLDSSVLDINGGKSPLSNSMDNLIERVNELINEYVSANIKEPKMIGYLYRTGGGSNSKGSSVLVRSNRTYLALDFTIGYEIVVGESEYLSTGTYEETKNRNGRLGFQPMQSKKSHPTLSDYEWIEWTQEREDFFKATHEHLIGMINKVDEFFGVEDPKQLESKVDMKLSEMKLLS